MLKEILNVVALGSMAKGIKGIRPCESMKDILNGQLSSRRYDIASMI